MSEKRYILMDKNNNKISVHSVEISSDYVGICPVLGLPENIKLSRIGNCKIFLTEGYFLMEVR